jgi:serine protease Do
VIRKASFDDTVVAAVEKVMPSVVNVSDVKLIQDTYMHVHPVQGVGSSIAIEPAMWVAKQLMEKGEIVRPRIRICAVDLNPQIVAYYELPVEHGVLVTGVMQNSQAAQAGILSGDIITRLGGSEINNVKDVIKVMDAHNVGDVVDIELIREG